MHHSPVVEKHKISFSPIVGIDVFGFVNFALQVVTYPPYFLDIVDDRFLAGLWISCGERVDAAPEDLQMWFAIAKVFPDHLGMLAMAIRETVVG